MSTPVAPAIAHEGFLLKNTQGLLKGRSSLGGFLYGLASVF